MGSDWEGTLEGIAFEVSRHRLDKQDRLLEELRSRTGVLLAAAALAASFLGREAFAKDPDEIPALVALAAFLVSTGCSLYVLVPRKNRFVFSFVGSRVYEELYALGDDVREIHRRLTYDMDRFWEGNDAELQKITKAYRVGVGSLVIEIVVLSAMVSGTIL